MDAPRDHKWLFVQSRCPLDRLDRLPSVDVDMPGTLDNMTGYDVATVVVGHGNDSDDNTASWREQGRSM